MTLNTINTKTKIIPNKKPIVKENRLSIIMPCENERIPLLFKTLHQYMNFGFPFPVEFVIPTRTIPNLIIPKLDIRVVHYKHNGYVQPIALNLGVRNAKNENVMITCPEIMPITNVLGQLKTKMRGNYQCQVFDLDPSGNRTMSLVNSGFRGNTPGKYFLAVFKKEDIEKINGWDENFNGYCFEDDDFGERFVRCGLKFQMLDEVVGEHQYHKRGSVDDKFYHNKRLFEENNKRKLIKPKNGLILLDNDVCA